MRPGEQSREGAGARKGERSRAMRVNMRLGIMGGVLLLLLFWAFSKGKEIAPGGEEKENPEETSAVISLSRVGKIRIFPSNPDLGATLNAEVTQDNVSQGAVQYDYRWRVNGKEVGDQPALPLQGFHQGDLVELEVTPSNGGGAGLPVRSLPVMIGNRPPKITRLRLVPNTPAVGEAVRAEVEATDADGNSIQYKYQWYVNDQPIEGDQGELLDGKRFHSGDTIHVIITPFDGFSDGPARTAQPVLVVNRPPKISSMPPTEMKGGQYVYQISANEPDGDTLRFQLVQGPSGMTLDSASGLLVWKTDVSSDKETEVIVEVDDAKGGKDIQQFTLRR